MIDLAHGRALEQLGDSRVGARDALVLGLVGARGDLDPRAHLAVDLHRDLDRLLDEPARIGGRERLRR